MSETTGHTDNPPSVPVALTCVVNPPTSYKGDPGDLAAARLANPAPGEPPGCYITDILVESGGE